jgi:ABC-type transporter Mla subunit MlaD
MVATADTTRQTVNEGASEALRATSEASHHTLQSAQDIMQTTQQTARTYLEQSTEANRKLFDAYAQGVEAAIKGGFEVQNAIFAAGMSFIDASANSSRNVVQQWTEIAREAQQGTLDKWQAIVGAGDRILASAASGEMSGQEGKGRRR